MYLKTKKEYQDKMYQEIMDFLFNNIYSAPIGQKLDWHGKVKGSSW